MAKEWQYGPYHRFQNRDQNELVARTGLLGGRSRRNIYAGLIPAVKAYEGSLPQGYSGIEFYTNVAPDRGGVPGQATWSGKRPGIIHDSTEELVYIAVKIEMQVDDATS